MSSEHIEYSLKYEGFPYVLFIIGTTFIAVGLINYIRPSIWGSPLMLIPGGLLLVIAIGATIQRLHIKNVVFSALRPSTHIRVENLASELNIRENDVRGAILDLRTEGRIEVTFDQYSARYFLHSKD